MIYELLRRLYKPLPPLGWKNIAWLSFIISTGHFLARLVPNFVILRQSPPSFPDLPVEVLTEIFQFATYLHEAENILPLDPFIPQQISRNALGPNTALSTMRTKCALVLVCRSWRNVAIPLLYRHLVIRSPQRAIYLLSALESRLPMPVDATTPTRPSEYGRFARHLEIYTHSRGSNAYNFLLTICHIIQKSPNLRIISGSWNHALPAGFPQSVSQMCGPTLQGLLWSESCPDSPTFAKFLSSFQSLRVLDISRVPRHRAEDISLSLPSIQDLIISTHTGSMSLATSISMPRLHTLVLRLESNAPESSTYIRKFLKARGIALRTLHILPSLGIDDQNILYNFHIPFRDCTCLETLTFHVNHTPSFHHPTVKRVGIHGLKSEAFEHGKTNSGKTCLKTLATRSLYPCLETVRTVDYLVENHTLSLGHYILWSEKFERLGVDFQDGAGIVWMYTEALDIDGGGESSNDRSCEEATLL
ncbi:MAG: hypothetical protein NXY57DRAFT_959289 [Lentinula lateritia]|uniref:F-box domain-containing protein n=1 Tax=Lentinula lateritia TaxID=40482 RepID=A0ABQ8VHL4_9AGAR|nr:MAG: hypothetical protein NXY57DRAFT_959289 [Lentinula lateritia]KAJ4494428.1 hypothetical protein C8R41DRAFT_919103 [Lentinula lateritia]